MPSSSYASILGALQNKQNRPLLQDLNVQLENSPEQVENAVSTRIRLAVTAKNFAQMSLNMMQFENEKCYCGILPQVVVDDQNYEMWTRRQHWSIFWVTFIT